ncbi:MAG: CoA pyrophosphatase [Pirellulales bacterium]
MVAKWTETDLPDRIERSLPGLPLHGAHDRYASELTYGRHKGPPSADARRAAVLIHLFPTDQGWSLPLTLRPTNLRPHGGQISLPGGALEGNETSEEAARREFEEELGVPCSTVRMLGSLSPIFVFASNHLVTPWLAVGESHPKWRPQVSEVAEVIELPLENLMDPGSLRYTLRAVRGVQFRSPHIALGSHQIWGATCLILGEVVQMLEAAVG